MGIPNYPAAMATQFDEMFRREGALWQGEALQSVVDLGQSVLYAGMEGAFTTLWTSLVPGAQRSFTAFLTWLHEQVPDSAVDLYAMVGAIRSWADFEMGARLEAFRAQANTWMYNTSRASGQKFAEKATEAAGRFAPATLRADLKFDHVNRDALDWAENRSAALVTGIDNVMRRNIQVVIANGQAGHFTTTQMAREIYDFIPLLPSHTASLINNRTKMIASGIKPKQADMITKANARRYRRYRAESIARTETILANNYGVDSYIRAKQDRGLLPGSAVRVWIATRDDRTCPRCAPMHGKTSSIDGAWIAPGAKPGTEVRIPLPPLHPQCRCAIGVYIAEAHTTKEVEEMWAPILA